MDPREDEDPPFDDSDENEPLIRELRLEMVRLQAQLDQLTAAVRERVEEAADLRVRLEELERIIDGIRARYRKQARLWAWIAALYGASLGMTLSWLLR
jgi:predicted transcriptional regulator